MVTITETTYPEHAKLDAARDQGSEEIGQFLEWLGEQGIRLCKMENKGTDNWPSWSLQPIDANYMQLLAQYFGVDLKQIEAEKRAMLQAMRGAPHV